MNPHKKTTLLLSLIICILSVKLHAEESDFTIQAKEQKEVVEAVGQQLKDNYVFPEMAEKMAKQISKNLKKGQYKKLNDVRTFSNQLTKDLVAISNDKHIRVVFNPERIADQKRAVTPEDEQKLLEQAINRRRLGNFGFNEVKIMEGNIGYLDLRAFQEPSYAGETAVAAMNFLSNSDAIIIDLRQNGGGSPQMIQLISSYLFGEEPVHLNNFYWRPTDSHTQTWTLPHVSGKRSPDVPVYVLTSNRTFSAAEEFSYNLKNLERATLIGETTGGGAHPGGSVIATDRFEVFVPSGRAINPITNSNWEGTGVSPHVDVKQELALGIAYQHALETLIAKNDDDQAQNVYNWILEGLKSENQIIELSEQDIQSYAGTYGPRKVTIENNDLYYQRGEGEKYKLVPIGDNKFLIKEIPYFRIQFEREHEHVTALIGLYNNGRTDKNTKD